MPRRRVTALAAIELVARGAADLDGDVNGQLTSWRSHTHRCVSPGRGTCRR
jgi:hypothetical protein